METGRNKYNDTFFLITPVCSHMPISWHNILRGFGNELLKIFICYVVEKEVTHKKVNKTIHHLKPCLPPNPFCQILLWMFLINTHRKLTEHYCILARTAISYLQMNTTDPWAEFTTKDSCRYWCLIYYTLYITTQSTQLVLLWIIKCDYYVVESLMRECLS